MDEIVDTECLPDQASLFSSNTEDNNTPGIKPLEVWRMLDLTPEKAQEVIARRGQQEAVWEIAKTVLSQKLLFFYIMYFVTCLIVMFFRALVSRYLPGFKSPDAFMVFIASNFIYLGFLMLLSLAYGLYMQFGWWVALVAVLLVITLPSVYQWMFVPGSLTWATIFVVAVIGVTFILKRTRWGKGWTFRIAEVRQTNITNNKDRAGFQEKVEDFLRSADEKSSRWLLHRNVFKWLRKYVVKSSLDVVFLILTRPELVERKKALEQYVKHHRFKDSMGRLATVVFAVGALAYLIFPDSLWAEEAALAVGNVLPIYIATMFMMNLLDESREEVFGELAELIRTDLPA
jgi:hypothetical protein